MSFDPSATGHQAMCFFGAQYATGAHRCFAWSGAPPSPVAPSAGADIDGVSAQPTLDTDVTPGSPTFGQLVSKGARHGWLSLPGFPVKVEASAAFSAGALLQTGSDGRVAAIAAGKAVLRALEASSGAGSLVWAVFTSGR